MTTARVATSPRTSTRPLPAAVLALGVMSWISAVLVLDSDGGRWLQRLLGVATWALLVFVLAREPSLVRVQTAIVVVFASLVEYTFSPLLEVYTYRFDNVPAYVPPGHGLVYLAALAIGRTVFVRTHASVCRTLAVTAVGAWAAYGLVLAQRADVLGAFWFVCLAGFLRWGPSPGLYVGAALVVSYLEIVGTSLGTWAWQPNDPSGLVAMGNPPSGAAGGYGWFDLAATLLAPALLVRWRRARSRGRSRVVNPSRGDSPRRP